MDKSKETKQEILQDKTCRTCAYRSKGNCFHNKVAVTKSMSCSHWMSKKY